MLKIKSTLGINLNITGSITQVPTLRGKNIKETYLGSEKVEATRGVINITVNINRIDADDYSNLLSIFLSMDSFDISDTSKGVYYSDYFIYDDNLNMEEKYDSATGGTYYQGILQLHKI